MGRCLTKGFALTLAGLIWCSAAAAFEWSVAPPEEQGVNGEALAELTQRLESGELGSIDGLMIVRGGQQIYRRHFRGYQGQPLPVYSVTKSIGSVLLGTLVRDDLLDITAPINDHFTQYPELAGDAARGRITVEHVLKQRHGHDWVEWPYGRTDHPIDAMLRSSDWNRTVLNWPLEGPPDQVFRYSTGASGLMSGIIRDVTGQTTQQYLREALLAPLGITNVRWGITCLNTRQICVPEQDFPGGNAPLGFGLWLTLPDLARVGLMMLDGGRFDEQQILTPDWIAASVQPYSSDSTDPEVFTTPGSGYGYQWWTTRITDDLGRTFSMHYANGYGRQYILLLPELNLLLAQLSADYEYEGPGIGTALREVILPAMSVEAGAVPITDVLNGSWYDPATDGQGLNLEILESRSEALAYWYTYDELGNQQWFIGQGPYRDGQAELELLTTRGGRPAQPDPVEVQAWGTAQLSFASCREGQMTFAAADGSSSGTIPLTRLTGEERCAAAKGTPLVR